MDVCALHLDFDILINIAHPYRLEELRRLRRDEIEQIVYIGYFRRKRRGDGQKTDSEHRKHDAKTSPRVAMRSFLKRQPKFFANAIANSLEAFLIE